MLRVASPRARTRRSSALELAIAFALGGSVLAVAVPTIVRDVHASRFVEPVDGLKRIGVAAVAYASARPVAQGFPPRAPLTPSAPPRGRSEIDTPDAWDHPTWRALDFRPVPEGTPHCFAFSFDSALSPGKATFRAQAHADLDGDGTPSTFEVTGQYAQGDPRGAFVDPGMFIEQEIE
jgi:hypothetical protein